MLVKKLITIMLLAITVLSCSKDDAPATVPAITFSKAEGKAINGVFTITGTITSSVNLLKVVLTKQGESAPFIVDDTTAKNKNSYAYSYLVEGITADTTILIDVYDQNGGKTSVSYLILK